MTARYRFGPLERRGLVAGWRGGQVASVAVGLTLGVGVLRWRPDGAGLAAATLAVGCSLFAASWPVRGSTLEQWAPLVLRWGAGGALRRRRHLSSAPLDGVLMRVADRTATFHRDRPPASRPPGRRVPPGGRPRRASASSGRAGPFRGVEVLCPEVASSGRRLGIVHDARAGTFTGVLAVAGGAFALLGQDEKEGMVARWSGVLAALARERSAVHRVQWVQRVLPDDVSTPRAHLREHAKVDGGHPALRSYCELLASPASGNRHELLVAVSVHAVRSAGAVRAAGGGDRGACAVLSGELLSLERRLRAAGVHVDGALGPRALAGALRRGARATAAAADRFAGPSHPWPVAMDLEWSRVRFDSAWHATYWVAEWPRVDVGPDFLAPAMLHRSLGRAISVTMEPLDPVRAGREVERARTADLADAELRRRGGFTRTARRRREEEGLARRETELADGHAEYRFSGYVTVAAEDPASLEAACSEAEQAAAQARIELRRLYGDQARAFTYTLPLCRGLS